jgi:gliding motility-associated-like protein
MRLLFSILIGFSTLFSCSYAQSGGNSISLSTSGQRSICQGDSLKINVTNLASNETYTFQWLKDDNIINGENQSSIVLKQSGTYKVRVTKGGQTETIGSLNLTINPKPVADFSFTPSSGCGKTTVRFTNNSHNGTSGQTSNLEYLWSFGNNKSSDKRNPDPVKYSPPAGSGSFTYTIKLIIKNTQTECRDTVTKQLTLSSGSEASLSSNADSIIFNGEYFITKCTSQPNAEIIFRNTASISNSEYIIDWGDNSPNYASTVFTSLSHIYSIGIYKLKLIAKGGTCNDTSFYNVFVGSNPKLTVGNPGNTKICTGDSLTFPITDISNNPPGTIYKFIVNDGRTDTLKFIDNVPSSVSIKFFKSSCGVLTDDISNSFRVRVRAENPCGSTNISINDIYVSQKPTPDFSILPGSPICVGTTVNFKNIGKAGEAIIQNSALGDCGGGKFIWEISPSTGWTTVSGSLGSDGGSSGNINPWTSGLNDLSINFTNPGIYSVKLKIGSSQCGIWDTVKTICVNPTPAVSMKLNNIATNKISICAGETVAAVSNATNAPSCGTFSYAWSVTAANIASCSPSSLPTIQSAGSTSTNLTFTAPGLYTVSLTVSAPGGCTSILTQQVEVKDKPIVSISSLPTSICQDGSISPVATATCFVDNTTTYLWTFPGGTTSSALNIPNPPNISFNTSGTPAISLAVTNSCGTTTVAPSFTVVAKPVVAAISSPAPGVGLPANAVCVNSTLQLSNTTPGGSWSSSNASIASIDPNTGLVTGKATGAATITYTVIQNNCSTSVSKTITVNPIPALTTAGTTSICTNGSTTITVSSTSANSFSWAPATGLNQTTGSQVIASPASTTTYAVTGLITATGCSSNAAVTVTVNTLPTISIGVSSSTICEGSSTTLTASGASSYTWTSNPSLVLASSASITSSPTVTTQYTVTGTNWANCSSTAVATVTVNSRPTITVNSPSTCMNSPVGLTASGADTYTWSPATYLSVLNAATVTSTPIAAQNISYTVTGRNSATGCTNTAVSTVTVKALPNVTVNSPTICPGSSATLTASGATTYAWESSNTLSSISGSPVTATPSATTTYVVTGTDASSGCSKSATSTVTVTPIPSISALGSNPTTCNGNNGSILITGLTTGASYTVKYTYLGTENTFGPLTATSGGVTVPGLRSGVYSNIYVTFSGCNTQPIASVSLTDPSAPTAPTISPVSAICSGQTLTLTVSNPIAGATYTWSGPSGYSNSGVNVTSVNVSNQGTYQVTATQNSCLSAPGSITVTVNPTPSAPLVTNVNYCQGAVSSALTASFDAVNTIYWYSTPTGGTGSTTAPTPSTTIAMPISYYVSQRTSLGCESPRSRIDAIVSPIPTISVQKSNPVTCNGAEGSLIISGFTSGTTYSVFFRKNGVPETRSLVADGSGVVRIIGLNKGTYTDVYVTLGSCTSNTVAGPFELTDPPTPSKPVLSGNSPICSDNTLSISVTNPSVGATYNWIGPNGYTFSSSSTGALSRANSTTNMSGNYAVSMTVANCVSPSETINIVVNQTPPEPIVTSPIVYCQGITATPLTATVLSGYATNWYTPSSGVSGTLTAPTPSTTTVGSYTYFVSQTSNFGCESPKASIVVIVNSTPFITDKSLLFCSDAQINFAPTGAPAGTTYIWSLPVITPANSIIGASSQTTPSSTFTQVLKNITAVSAAAEYIVTPKVGSCTGPDFKINVTVEPKPSIENENLAAICSGGSINFVPTSGGVNIIPSNTLYRWTVSSITPSGSVTGAVAQTSPAASISQLLTNVTNVPATVVYTVTPVSGNCTGSNFNVSVVVNPRPKIQDLNLVICSGQTFTANLLNNQPTSIIPSTTLYTWPTPVSTGSNAITGGAAQATGSAVISQTLINTTTSQQTLTYTITPLAGSCVGTDFRVIVTVNPQPNIAPKKDTICSGETFIIQPSDAPIGTNYTWTVKDILPSGSIVGASVQTNPQVNVSQTLTSNFNSNAKVIYSVLPTSGSCGGSGFEIEVLINPKPYISTLTDTICNGQTFAVVPKHGSNNNIIPVNTTYTWTSPNAVPAGSVTGGSSNGKQQNQVSQQLFNSSDAPGLLNYKVNPLSGSNGNCIGPVFDVFVLVNPDAKAVFNPTDTIGCPPYLINSSKVRLQQFSQRNENYIWYVDGQLQGNGIGLPNYTIQNEDDTILLKLITTSLYGCKSDSTIRKFITYKLPHPEFKLSDTVGCGPLQISATNTTPNSSLFTYSWNFGNGTTSTLQNPPSLTYFSNPTFFDTTYLVKLDVKSVCNVVSLSKTVRIKARPKAVFAPTSTIGCSPFKVSFNNNSRGLGNTYFWDFGDGFKDTLLTKDGVSHTYYTKVRDTFYAKLLVKNECGFDTAQYAIIVSPNSIKLDFVVNGDQKEGCVQHTVNFVNVSSGASAFRWDFGDGNIKSTNKNIDTVTHTYLQPGVYNVTLFATNGCTDTVSTEKITVFSLPNPDFAYKSLSGCIGDSVYFTNNSTAADSYLWKFGDGKSVKFVNPGHRYSQKGLYKVKLIAYKTNAPGVVCSDSIERVISIVDTINVSYRYSDSVSNCIPFKVTFVNNYRNNLYAEWNFGDGIIKRGDSLEHVYNSIGTFNAKLLVKFLGGCNYVASKPVIVSSPTGSVKLKSGYSCIQDNIRFEALPFDTDTIIWDFGDGIKVKTVDRVIYHKYSNAGFYIPSVTFLSKFGCSYKVPLNDTLKIDNVAGGFTYLQEQFCGFTRVDFKDTTKTFFGKSSVEWRFGDGATGNLFNNSNNFNATNTYLVQSIVTGISGCKDTTFQNIPVFVRNKPAVQIGGDTLSCSGISMTLNAFVKSQDSISLQKWVVPTGSITYGNQYRNIFATPGNYQINFISGTVFGCYDTTKVIAKVYPTPVVKAAPDILLCKGNKISLSATGADRYNWYPNDGLSCTDCQSPIASPKSSIYYTVKGTTQYGCFSYDTLLVTVVPDFKINVSKNDSICIGDSVLLMATGAKYYDWSPGIGLSTVNNQNPFAKPLKTTQYRVVGYDEYGCFRDTGYVTVYVSEYPKLDLGPDQVLATGKLFTLAPKYTAGPIQYWKWTPSKDLSCDNCEKPIVRIRNQITYTATATNYFGCAGSDSITFKVFCENTQVYIPNAFTPDNDGLNDKFMVRASGIQLVKSFRIFNRWGELVFEKTNFQPNDPANGWDGKIRGIIQGPDVFVYTVEVLCDNGIPYFYKGNVSLLK